METAAYPTDDPAGRPSKAHNFWTHPAEADGLRWLNVREPGGKVGWSAAQYLQVVASPTVATPPPATATPTATPTPTPAPVGTGGTGSPGAGPTAAATGALAIDARVKLPETDGREQTLTITVTRGGAPVVDAQVVSVTGDTDPPIVREFDPTDAQGKTVKTFDIRQEKGTVVVVIVAVAPDGAKANTTATYYRR